MKPPFGQRPPDGGVSGRQATGPSAEESGALRFALAIVAVVAVATLALGLYFYRNPVGIGVWIARTGLEKAGLEKMRTSGPRGPLTYYQGGEGRRTLVLVHDLGNQAGSWLKVVADLATRYRLIVPDLPGHGESAPGPTDVGQDDLLWGLAAVIDAAVIDAAVPDSGSLEPGVAEPGQARLVPLTVVGNGMGAWIAARHALARPGRVGHLVLVNASGLAGTEPLGRARLPENREQAADWVRALGPADGRVPAGFVLDDMVRRLRQGPTASVLGRLGPEQQLDPVALAELEMPVDLLWGLDDGLFPAEIGRRFASFLPDARFHGLEDCGHLPPQQCPALFVTSLGRALAARE